MDTYFSSGIFERNHCISHKTWRPSRRWNYFRYVCRIKNILHVFINKYIVTLIKTILESIRLHTLRNSGTVMGTEIGGTRAVPTGSSSLLTSTMKNSYLRDLIQATTVSPTTEFPSMYIINSIFFLSNNRFCTVTDIFLFTMTTNILILTHFKILTF